MPGKTSKSQRNLTDQIDELRRKKLLLEGERKAYYEGAEHSQKQLDERVTQLQSENSDLHKIIANKLAADEYVVSKGLEGNETERKALRNKPGRVAVVLMDEKVCDRVNVLNSLQYNTKRKEKQLKELETQHDKMTGGSTENSPAAESEDGQKIRSLENRLDKAKLKCKEADHIQKTYLQIKSKLEDEHKTFENTLDEMEQDVQRLKLQLKELRVMQNDAIIRRDKAKAELEQEEKDVYADKKQRELEIQKVRKEAERKKVQAQIIQRRIDARGSMAQDDFAVDQLRASGLAAEDEHEKIKTLEEAFRRIKDATGVSDTREVVLRFENQGETGRHLVHLKSENDKEIEKLTVKKKDLQSEYEQMKYSGETKLSSGQHLLEEYEKRLLDEERREEESQMKLEKRSKLLGKVRSGVDHLNKKLETLKAPPLDVPRAKVSPEVDEFVLDQLSVCEAKLTKLIEDVDTLGKDANTIRDLVNQDEFQSSMQIKLPVYNTRVKLPTVTKDTIYDDEDTSGEDEDVLSRQNLKKQSQDIVDSKMRRRPLKRKKKTPTK